MKNARFGLPLVLGTLVSTACASGSGGGGEFDEGNPPRDNTHTRNAELYLTQAEALGDTDRYVEALASATNSIMEEPMNPQGYYQAGRAQLGMEDYVAADTLFDKALELYPPYSEDVRIEREGAWISMYNQSIESLNAGDNEAGVRFLEMAEVIFPGERPEALINLGVSYNGLGRLDDAIDAFGAALAIIRAPYRETVDSATQAGWAANESAVSNNRARLLSQDGRHDEAAAEYEALLERHPGDVSALSSLAAVISEAGQPDSAQAIYTHLLTQPGLGARDYFNIGVGLYTAEVYDQAAEAFRIVAEVGPENRDALYNYAQSLHEAEDWEPLLAVGRELIDLDGYNSASYAILARALINTGDEQGGVRILQSGADLPFILEGALEPRSTGGGSLTGYLTNQSLEPGMTVDIRVHFIAEDGANIGFTDARVTVPDQDVAQEFRADFTSEEGLLGFYFEVIGNPG